MRFTTIALLIATASAAGRRRITEDEACTLQHKVSPTIKLKLLLTYAIKYHSHLISE